MRVYFLRHGDAEHAGPGGDSPRRLSKKGRRDLRMVARGLVRLDLGLDRIYTSPLVRAKETAEIVAEPLGLLDSTEVTDALEPEADWGRLRDVLRGASPDDRILLVGHMPSFGEFISALVSERGVLRLDVKKSGLTCIEVDDLDHGGILRWHLTPKQLSLLGET